MLIDNTTLHRAAYLLGDEGGTLSSFDVANVLHLLECLILGDDLTVTAFEDDESAERSSRIRAALGDQGLGTLISDTAMSAPDEQRRVAALVTRDMQVRRLLPFAADSPTDFPDVDTVPGLPLHAGNRVPDFWATAFEGNPSDEDLIARGGEQVEEYRAGGLFIDGLVQHADLIDRLRVADANGSAPLPDEWRQMHVVFRALFNQRLAQEIGGMRYAAPPVRSGVLDAVSSVAWTTLEASARQIVLDLGERDANPDLVGDLRASSELPLPLLGLSLVLRESVKPDVPIVERLVAAREAAAPIRARLARVRSSGSQMSAAERRQLNAEVQAFDRVGRKALGLQTTAMRIQLSGSVVVHPDPPRVVIDPITPLVEATTGVGVGLAGWWRGRAYTVLCDGLSELAQSRSVEGALRQVRGLSHG